MTLSLVHFLYAGGRALGKGAGVDLQLGHWLLGQDRVPAMIITDMSQMGTE